MNRQVTKGMEARPFLVSYEHFRTMRILLREALEILPPGVVEAGPPSGEMHKALIAWHTYITNYLDKYYPGELEQADRWGGEEERS